MEEIIKVGIAEMKLCKTPNKITTIGLGSCVGIVLYSLSYDICGLVHIMLPSSKEIANNINRVKFADTGVEDLVVALERRGVRRSALNAKIAGGATMFQFSGKSDLVSVGDRNVQAVKEALAAFRIPILAEDVGEDYGRTIVFDNNMRQLTIRCAGRPDKVI